MTGCGGRALAREARSAFARVAARSGTPGTLAVPAVAVLFRRVCGSHVGAAIVGVVLLGVVAAAVADGWRAARPDYPWSFPQDHWARPGYRLEWWYFTGHLDATDGARRRFGYQFTIFRVGLSPEPESRPSAWSAANLVMGHAAVGDLGGGRHVFSEVLYREMGLLGGFGVYPEPLIAWSRAPAGTDGRWTLHWNARAFDLAMTDRARGIAFRLATAPLKPLVFQGPNGYSRKGEGPTAASQYYSFTRLRTTGTLSLDGADFAVRGESWMDKEFGSNQLGDRQVGWDWLSLQLADGREVMLYLLRDRAGALDFGRGTVVAADGTARYLTPAEWRVRATAHWTSPATGARYPSAWMVEVPSEDLRLRVEPELSDQENRSRLVPDLHYWEGAVRVLGPDGAPLGRGYVELTGYGTRSRPAV
jgi:predicted secreted hydrolase